MSNPAELATIIGFGLNRLRTQNRHHDFEHLCRDLARARIASNILPATGPVAGGGDQGRDFETFHTYLVNTLSPVSSFIGRASGDTIAFACTVQQNGLYAKMLADVASICSQGVEVQRIYFFCTEPLRVSDRHNAQRWAAEEYGIALEVIDGPTIAELLSDYDVFWIAQTHLHLPLELAPPPPPDGSTKTPTREASIRQADHELARAIDLLASHTERSPLELGPRDFRAAFASELRALHRLSRSPGLGEISTKAGCEESLVSDYLSGKKLPGRYRLVAIVQAMIEYAKDRKIELPENQLDVRSWERKWRVAKRSGMQKIVKNKALGKSR